MSISRQRLCTRCKTALPPVDDPTARYVVCPQCKAKNDLAGDQTVVGDRTPRPARKAAPRGELAGRIIGDGRYRLDKRIGGGGMGTVYRGTQLGLDRSVAIKILADDLARDKVFIERFLREAKTLATFQQVPIVTVYDAGSEGDLHYIVMQYVTGPDGKPRTLKQILEEGPLPVDKAMRIVREACKALHCAHGKKIIHRDVKPGNVLIDSGGNALLADFGIASSRRRAGDTTLTVSGESIGTPDYVAPEQLKDATCADARSDLYSLGVMLYEMLTGMLPRGAKIAPPSKLHAEVGKNLDAVVMRAIEPDPEKRFQSAKEFDQAIAALASAEGSSRRPVMIGAAVTFAVVVIAAGVLFLLNRKPTLRSLLDAVQSDNISDVKQILDRNANLLKQHDADGKTPLHLAASGDDLDAVDELLERGADVNARDNEGRTPLHDAADAGRANAVRALLKHGADRAVVDHASKTALDLARAGPWPQVVVLLSPSNATDTSTAKDYPHVQSPPPGVPSQTTNPPPASSPLISSNSQPQPQPEPVAAVMRSLGPTTNSIGMKLVPIPAGTFMMGSPIDESRRGRNETQHRVTLTTAFLMSTTPVTVSQFQQFISETQYQTSAEKVGYALRFVGNQFTRMPGESWRNSPLTGDESCPVIDVTWDDAMAFCGWLSTKESVQYHLPTEAQWEYACRAGTTTVYYNGDSVSRLGDVAWYKFNSSGSTHPVGQKQPNAWGLYDMLGNVYQWCADWYGNYPGQSVVDPRGPAFGQKRVDRGGCWNEPAKWSRCAARNSDPPEADNAGVGFRIVCELRATPSQVTVSTPPPQLPPAAAVPSPAPRLTQTATPPPSAPPSAVLAPPVIATAPQAARDFAAAFSPIDRTYAATINGQNVQLKFQGDEKLPFRVRLESDQGVCLATTAGGLSVIFLADAPAGMPALKTGQDNYLLPLHPGDGGQLGFFWKTGEQTVKFTISQ